MICPTCQSDTSKIPSYRENSIPTIQEEVKIPKAKVPLMSDETKANVKFLALSLSIMCGVISFVIFVPYYVGLVSEIVSEKYLPQKFMGVPPYHIMESWLDGLLTILIGAIGFGLSGILLSVLFHLSSDIAGNLLNRKKNE